MTGRHPAQVRAAALAAIGRAKAWHDRHAARGPIDRALVAWIRRRQHDPFDVNFAAGQQVVDVPELGRSTILPGATAVSAVSGATRLTADTAVAQADVPPHASPQAAGGAAGVHIRARREAERAETTNADTDCD